MSEPGNQENPQKEMTPRELILRAIDQEGARCPWVKALIISLSFGGPAAVPFGLKHLRELREMNWQNRGTSHSSMAQKERDEKEKRIKK